MRAQSTLTSGQEALLHNHRLKHKPLLFDFLKLLLNLVFLDAEFLFPLKLELLDLLFSALLVTRLLRHSQLHSSNPL